MKLLYLAHRIPYPPNKGEKIRSFHQILYLAKKHEVHLACLIDEQEDWQHIEKLKESCVSVDAVYRGKTAAKCLAIVALLSNRPLSVVSFFSWKLQQRINQRLDAEKFDRVLVSSAAMAEYVKKVQGMPKVIDFIDVDSDKWKLYAEHHSFPLSWVYRIEARRLARYEEEIARAFNHSIFTSEAECALFRQRVSDRPISVVSNGVDLSYFIPPQERATLPSRPMLVFIGAMDYFPNVDAVQYFCVEILPLIREVEPSAEFYIVGRNPSRKVIELRTLPHVIVTGSVPDVRPFLARATVAVAPFRLARGVQNKVLEALAMGLPVVGSSEAFQGIPATIDDGVQIADEPRKFAQAVLTFIRKDSVSQHQWSKQARCYVERHHRWDQVGAELERVLLKANSGCVSGDKLSPTQRGGANISQLVQVLE